MSESIKDKQHRGIRSPEEWYQDGTIILQNVGHRAFLIAKCESGYYAEYIADAPKIIKELKAENERLRLEIKRIRSMAMGTTLEGDEL